MAEEDTSDLPRPLSEETALISIGRTLVTLVDELRTQTLVAYLQTLIMNSRPNAQTKAQIEVVGHVLEQRLGFEDAS